MSHKLNLIQLGSLQQVTGVNIKASSDGLPRVSCITLCHNEVMIVDQFLDHYRALGVDQFYIVDDHSTDGSFENLQDQPDVTVFRPVEGASFKDNLAAWRQDILDCFCDDAWVCLPDMDEFLYVRNGAGPLPLFAQSMDHDGVRALMAVMVEMYADQPIAEQQYQGTRPLKDVYPFFDGQGTPPHGLRISALPQSFATRFPTPAVCFMGGVRERLFFTPKSLSKLQCTLLTRYSSMKRPLNPNRLQVWQNKITRALTKSAFTRSPIVLNKFALLKWQAGMKFHRAPHAIDTAVPVSESVAALLHYKFYKGVTGYEYNAKRGQHAGGGQIYKSMLSQPDALTQSPMCNATRRFDGVASLEDILR